MTERRWLVRFLWGLLLLVGVALHQAAFAAVMVTPTVPGLAGGSFGPVAGAAATEAGFSVQGAVTVSGKVVQIPGVLPLASNAADFAKRSLFANPWLAGLALLTWSGDAGLHSDQVGGWQLRIAGTQGGSYSGYGLGTKGCSNGDICLSTREQVCAAAGGSFNAITWDCTVSYSTCASLGYSGCSSPTQALYVGSRQWTVQSAPDTVRPATVDDFLALPNPPVLVYPELAAALGVPVESPVYQPVDVPLSDPYKMPDWSTRQSRAAISPASNGQVNIVTYEMPVTDASGQPVNNPQPTPNPDPQPSECQLHPDTLGCMPAGTDSFAVPGKDVPFAFTPEASPIAGQCPGAVSVLGSSISFQSSCDAMGMIKPFVLLAASIMAAFILLGAFRSGGD